MWTLPLRRSDWAVALGYSRGGGAREVGQLGGSGATPQQSSSREVALSEGGAKERSLRAARAASPGLWGSFRRLAASPAPRDISSGKLRSACCQAASRVWRCRRFGRPRCVDNSLLPSRRESSDARQTISADLTLASSGRILPSFLRSRVLVECMSRTS